MSSTLASTSGKGYLFVLGAMSFAVFLTVTAIAMLGPLLVELASAFSVTVPAAAQLVTTAATTWAVTALIIGPVSDTYGRKPVLLVGTCLLATGSLGIGLAPSFAVAIGFSALAGAGGGMVPPTCIALIGDTFPGKRRPMAIAILTMQPGMASVVGVPLTAIVADLAGWRTSFVALGLGLGLSTLVLLMLVPHYRPQTTNLNLAHRLHRVFAFPVTWHLAGTNVMARITWGVILTFFPAFLIVTYDLRMVEVALPVAIVAIGATAAPLLGGRIARGRRRLPITAALLFTAAVPGLGVFFLDLGVWVSVAIAGFFLLLIVPVTTIILVLVAETGGSSRGALAGVISASNWSGTAAGAAIGGLLVAQIGFGALSVVLVGAILVSGLLMAFKVNDSAVARAHEHFSNSPANGPLNVRDKDP